MIILQKLNKQCCRKYLKQSIGALTVTYFVMNDVYTCEYDKAQKEINGILLQMIFT